MDFFWQLNSTGVGGFWVFLDFALSFLLVFPWVLSFFTKSSLSFLNKSKPLNLKHLPPCASFITFQFLQNLIKISVLWVKKHWLWSISTVLSNLQFQKLTTWAKMGKTLGFVKKIPPSELNWSWRFLSFFRILLEFFLDFAWVLSFSELEFFSQCPKKSPGYS